MASWAASMVLPKFPPRPSPPSRPSSLRSAPDAKTCSPAPVSTTTRTSAGTAWTAASRARKTAMERGLRRCGSLMVRRRTPSLGRSTSSGADSGIEGLLPPARRAGLACGGRWPGLLLDDGYGLPLLDHVTFLDQDLFDRARDRRQYRDLHLHGLQDHDGVVFLDLLSDLGRDLPEVAHQLCFYFRHA